MRYGDGSLSRLPSMEACICKVVEGVSEEEGNLGFGFGRRPLRLI